MPPLALREAPYPPLMKLETLTNPRDEDSAEDQKAATAYWEAAQAILRRAPDAQASANTPPGREAVPLPKKRPIPRV